MEVRFVEAGGDAAVVHPKSLVLGYLVPAAPVAFGLLCTSFRKARNNSVLPEKSLEGGCRFIEPDWDPEVVHPKNRVMRDCSPASSAAFDLF